MSLLDMHSSEISQLKVSICKDIGDGRIVDLKKALQGAMDRFKVVDITQLISPKRLGEIYLEALDKALEDIQEQIDSAITNDDDSLVNRLQNNREVAKERRQRIDDALSKHGQFVGIPDLRIQYNETGNIQRQ